MKFTTTTNSRPHNWLIHHYCGRSVQKHAHLLSGRLLDIGSGSSPYREFLQRHCTSYVALDHLGRQTSPTQPDIYGDAVLLPFRNKSFDSVASFQVLEHLPEPQSFFAEVFRVLRPGGTAFITTPFLWGEHEQPHDYFRFTRYGLQYLSRKAGFDIISITPDTGCWSMIGLRLNYRINNITSLKYILGPLMHAIQVLSYFLDSIDRKYTIDTCTFSTALRRPLAHTENDELIGEI